MPLPDAYMLTNHCIFAPGRCWRCPGQSRAGLCPCSCHPANRGHDLAPVPQNTSSGEGE